MVPTLVKMQQLPPPPPNVHQCNMNHACNAIFTQSPQLPSSISFHGPRPRNIRCIEFDTSGFAVVDTGMPAAAARMVGPYFHPRKGLAEHSSTARSAWYQRQSCTQGIAETHTCAQLPVFAQSPLGPYGRRPLLSCSSSLALVLRWPRSIQSTDRASCFAHQLGSMVPPSPLPHALAPSPTNETNSRAEENFSS